MTGTDLMAKAFWYTFYFGIFAGVLVGILLRTGFVDFNLSFITDSINNSIKLFNISPADSLYFTIIAVASIIGVILLMLYRLGRTLFDSGEYGIYGFGFGFFGALLIAIGLFSSIGALGLALIFIGMAISYRIERDPPGTPERKR